MEPLFLSRVKLRPDASTGERFWEAMGRDPLGHRMVWSWFGSEESSRSFLYRQEGSGTRAAFFVLGPRAPEDGSGVWDVETKEFAPKLREGDVLSFSVRVSPTIKRAARSGDAETDSAYVGKRVDVFMDAKKRFRSEGDGTRELDDDLLARTCAAWLGQKGQRGGFELVEDMFRADGYRRHRLPRRGGSAPATFSTVDLSGALRISDVSEFLSSLRSGFGPEKAFGCGLMLIRRA